MSYSKRPGAEAMTSSISYLYNYVHPWGSKETLYHVMVKRLGSVTWPGRLHILSQPLSRCVTLIFLCHDCLLFKIEVIKVPSPWGYGED